MPIIFLIIVLSAIGFGLVLPAFLFFAENLGGSAEIATAIVATYSVGQMISTPIWGRLSDRFGRKPILMLSLVGASLSYLGLAFSTELWMLAVARAFGGLMAGNFAAAMAYVSDVTSAENRAKGMGMVGAGMSIGFILGPAVGGFLSGSDAASASLLMPGLAAGLMSAITAIATGLFLKESLSREARQQLAGRKPESQLKAIKRVMGRPVVSRMVLVGFMFIGIAGMFETIFPLWSNARFAWGPKEVGLLFTYLGLLVAVVQGGLIGVLVRAFGEGRLVVVAAICYGVGLIIMAASAVWPMALFGITFTAIGSALFNPSMSSLVSQQAGAQERGFVIGVFQSATWLGRSTGPLLAGVLFTRVGVDAPLFTGAVLLLPCLGLILIVLQRMRQQQLAETPSVAEGT